MTLIESALCPAEFPPEEQTGNAICFECDYRWDAGPGATKCPECGGPAELLDGNSWSDTHKVVKTDRGWSWVELGTSIPDRCSFTYELFSDAVLDLEDHLGITRTSGEQEGT